MAKQYKYRESFTFEGKRYDVRANSEKELVEKMILKKKELEEGSKRIKSTSISVREWGTQCYETYKSNCSLSTIENDRWRVEKWIYGEIGSMRLKDVRELHLQTILNKMEGMGSDTIRKVRQDMNLIFSKAVQNNLIRENPAQYLTVPKGTKTTRREITPQERKHILKVAEENDKYVYYLFMLYCGCRTAEVANIMWKDIRKEDGLWYLDIHGTKTANAERTVPIPPQLIERLERMEKGSPFEYVFTDARGNKMSKASRARLWTSCKRALNISMGCRTYRNALVPPYPVAEDLQAYCLRHTYCCDLARMGVDVRIAQKLMGHARFDITMKIYTHVNKDMIKSAAKIMWQNHPDVATSVATSAENVAISI